MKRILKNIFNDLVFWSLILFLLYLVGLLQDNHFK
jgi:hypothetical protein